MIAIIASMASGGIVGWLVVEAGYSPLACIIFILANALLNALIIVGANQ